MTVDLATAAGASITRRGSTTVSSMFDVYLISEDPAVQLIAREATAPGTVTVAESIEKLARAQSVDLVLLDGGTGDATAIDRIRSTVGAVPVVVVGTDATLDSVLDVGANDRLPRPIRPLELHRMIDSWSHPPADAGELLAAAPSLPGFDLDAALERLPDVELFGRLISKYFESNAGLVGSLRSSVAAGDLVAVRALAHTARGTAAMLGIIGLEAAIRVLETAIQTEADIAELEQATDGIGIVMRRCNASAAIFRTPATRR